MPKKVQPHILVVDDDKRNIEQIEEKIKRSGFSNVDTACSYEEAVKKASDSHYDAIVSDMVMEDDDSGYNVIKEYRFLSPLVIIVTAYPDPNIMKKCFRAGAYDYIDKADNDSYQQIVDSLTTGLEELKEKNKKIDRDALFIQKEYVSLMTKYPGEYVAVLDERVVESGKDFDKLKAKMSKKFPYVNVTIVAMPQKEIQID